MSWQPRAFLFHNLLSDEECEHLKDLSRKQLTKSSVVDSATGKSVDSTVRTSSGTFLAKGQDDVVRRIEKRLSMVTMLPVGAPPRPACRLPNCAGRPPIRMHSPTPPRVHALLDAPPLAARAPQRTASRCRS